jgi:hypothetical protein
MPKPRPALFKWRDFEPEIIVCAVRWYLRFSLSYRDVEELTRGFSLPLLVARVRATRYRDSGWHARESSPGSQLGEQLWSSALNTAFAAGSTACRSRVLGAAPRRVAYLNGNVFTSLDRRLFRASARSID